MVSLLILMILYNITFLGEQQEILNNNMMSTDTRLDFSYLSTDNCIYVLYNGAVMGALPNPMQWTQPLLPDTVETIWLPDSTGGVTTPTEFVSNPIDNKIYIIGTDMRNVAVCDAQTGERLRTVLTGMGTVSLAYSETSNKIYCSNYDEHTVDVISCANDSVIKTIHLEGIPGTLAWNSNNNEIYCCILDVARVEVIDCGSDSIIQSIPTVGYPEPWGILFNPYLNKIYCTCYHPYGETDSIAVIDGNTYNIIARIAIGWPNHRLALNTVNNKIYCTNDQYESVSVIDGIGDSLITTIPIGDWPIGITYNPAMNRIYIGHVYSQNIYVLDCDTDQVIDIIHPGSVVWALTYDSLDNRLFVATQNDTAVYDKTIVIDCNTHEVIDHLPVGVWPRGIFWDNKFNQVWVANSGASNFPGYTIDGYSGDGLQHRFKTVVGFTPYNNCLNSLSNKYYSAGHADKFLAILDMNNPESCVLRETGHGAWDVIDNPLEDKIYVANRWTDTITIIDGTTDSIIAEIPADSEPVAFAFNHSDNKIYCGDLCDASVMVIDGHTNNVLKTIPVGNRPIPLLWNSIDNKLYVGNSIDTTVTIIDAHADTVITRVPAGRYMWSFVHNTINNKVYSVNFRSDNITVIDGASDSVVTTINIWGGARPYTLAYNSANNKIYCANVMGESITVIDGATDSIIKTIFISRGPYSLMYNPTTNTIFCAYITEELWQDAIIVIDGNTDEVLADFPIESFVWYYGLGSPKRALILDSLNNIVYFSHYYSSKISVIDGATGISETDHTILMPRESMLKLFPNPSTRDVKIAYTLPNANNLSVRIYDVTGRLVKQIDTAINNSPTGQVIWDRNDNFGKQVPNGVYFLKFQAGDYAETRKLILLR